jgi:hypothetical protein
MLNKFQLRKDIFDYLKNNLTNVEIVPEHPTGSSVTKARVVVQIIRDAASGRNYMTDLIENPEIQITAYANKELDLTKPNGLNFQIENLMKRYQATTKFNFHKIRDIYVGYDDATLSYSSYMIYRFYTGE